MRYGNQEPTFSTKIEYATTDGAEVVEWFDSMGHLSYPCQEYEMLLFCARDENDDFAYRTICISKPRQNGKSYSARNYAVEKAAVECLNVCYSAHHSKTTHKMFKEVLAIFENDEELSKMIADVSKARGFEGIWLANGGCIEFFTRSTRSGGGRGTTYDIIVVDEAQEMTEDEQDALKPTQIASESGDPQMILIGTPPGPSCNGTVFRALHDRAHDNPETCGFVWIEWAVYELPDMDGDRTAVLELAYMTNPAMGYRIRESVMMDVINTATSVDGFAREYLGWWSPTAGLPDFMIPSNKFQSLAVDVAPTGGRAAYGVKFSADGSEVSMCAARLHDGRVYIEQIKRESMALGLNWLATWIADRKNVGCCCVIDGKSGTQALVDKLGNMPRGYVEVPSAAQAVSACATLVDRVNDGTLEWYRPQADLLDSATTSTRRKIGHAGGWGFGGENPIPIEAASLALWGVLNSKRNPERKQRIG
jgi:hypothetical protein